MTVCTWTLHKIDCSIPFFIRRRLFPETNFLLIVFDSIRTLNENTDSVMTFVHSLFVSLIATKANLKLSSFKTQFTCYRCLTLSSAVYHIFIVIRFLSWVIFHTPVSSLLGLFFYVKFWSCFSLHKQTVINLFTNYFYFRPPTDRRGKTKQNKKRLNTFADVSVCWCCRNLWKNNFPLLFYFVFFLLMSLDDDLIIDSLGALNAIRLALGTCFSMKWHVTVTTNNWYFRRYFYQPLYHNSNSFFFFFSSLDPGQSKQLFHRFAKNVPW